jgi:cytochrome c oxidase subunit 2
MSPTPRVRRRPGSYPALAALVVTCAGCDAPMSIFGAAGDGGRRISGLAWFMIMTAAVVYVAVMALFLAAMWRNRSRDPGAVDLSRRGNGFIVWGGAVMPSLVLAAVFVAGLAAMGRFPARASERAPAFTVTGRQWWWQVDYDDPSLPGRFTTANELHVPVGETVRIRLLSGDVIHSFWVPGLQGKLDLIPGDTNEVRIHAEKAGTYRGQCAEFCGQQHANMAFTVVAEPRAQWAAWIAGQQQLAKEPADSLAASGRELVTGGPCAMCHTVRGTNARGQVGPDLTHVGSRLTIAAGTLPNTLGTMEAWIANAQSLKPGTKMPTLTQFSGRELRAVATYLETLK